MPRHAAASVLAVLTALAVILTAQPASAAPPGNDEPAGALPIGPLPAVAVQNTTEATYVPYGGCTSADAGANVWYTLTLATDERVVVDASGSDYNTGLNLFAGTPGPGTFLACQERSLRFDAQAGVTYYIEVAACCGSSLGGQLRLTAEVAPEPPVVTSTVNSVGYFDHAGGATVSGTASCASTVEFAAVEVVLSQRVGRVIISGQNGVNIYCYPGGDPVPWTVTVTSHNGLFRGGKATASVQSVGCNAAECASQYKDWALQLKGGGPRPPTASGPALPSRPGSVWS
ncbi:hypothetical protein Afil01_31670 [Actinorhabdospora filicis]|uniref:Uncharacterized protein n=1 Tax=Actinorhabdospora filicis TaxID=1785913 RepID=A0A9W6SM03_9ACTN|nr:hypothetical protein [Actinorhabdospora filicis]GLZ78360.1 hypothetical protein Afil01_31670 [Actinorhabdospora filicis]